METNMTPAVKYAQLATIKAGLKLEMRGMKMSKGPSALSVAKREGYTGNRETIIRTIEADMAQMLAQK